MRKFAWYGRLSTKDKQDPTLSFPSQRNECAEKAEELGGRIVCDFTDQEAGRRDDRVGWSELVREAKEPEARRFDAVIVYSTSRLSRELFHALAYERELARAGVEVFYARSAGDQTSPEGRLIRHMFQALDQFEVEKLGREVRRGQTENTRQGYRNGGRAPYGYRLRHEPHPDPPPSPGRGHEVAARRRPRAGAGDRRDVPALPRRLRLQGDRRPSEPPGRPSSAPPRRLQAQHLRQVVQEHDPRDPREPRLHRAPLLEPARLPRRQAGRGAAGPAQPEDWVEAEQRHEALVSEEDFERVQAEMKARSTGQGGNRRRYTQKRFYQLRGIVHCATGHNPLRMHGKHRKSSTYYTCGYRLSYGDTAAEATGHGKWQYVREDSLLTLIDAFFATRVFGPDRLAHFRKQSSTLEAEIQSKDGAERDACGPTLGEVEQRIERQLAAIEAGVDPALVGERIRTLKSERQEIEAAIAQLDHAQRNGDGFDPDEAAAILDSLPDLSKALRKPIPSCAARCSRRSGCGWRSTETAG